MAPPAKSNSPTKRRTAKFLRIAGEAGREGAELQEVERRLAEEARISEALHRIGISLTSELDLQKLVQAVTDEATALIGARFGAFFYNVVNERGETYLLYTLSGAPREAFAHFPMPRNTPLFGPTFRGEHVIRLADVTRDQRYGENPPYYGMPQGHLPVRSYLAASVVSRSGEVLGGLFFGHPEPEVFSERDERIVVGVAAQAAVAIDNARLYQQQQEAQQRLREQLAFTAALTHSLGEGVCACDREGRLVFVNPAAEQISGWSQEELLGNGIDEVIYAQRATDAALPRSECPLLRVIATKEVFHSDDGWFARKDGTMVPVSYTSAPILAEGQVRGTVVTFQDITVRKQAEEILRRSEERFSKIFHASPLPISIVTPAEGRFLDVNESFLCLIGYRRGEVVGRTSVELNLWADPRERARIAQQLETQGSAQTEVRFRTKSAEIREGVVSKVMINLGGELCVLSMLRDVTDRKRAEEALRESEERYRSLFENANDAIISIALDGTITAVNRGLEVITGWSREDLIGRHYSMIAAPQWLALAEERTLKALAREKPPATMRLRFGAKMGVSSRSKAALALSATVRESLSVTSLFYATSVIVSGWRRPCGRVSNIFVRSSNRLQMALHCSMTTGPSYT